MSVTFKANSSKFERNMRTIHQEIGVLMDRVTFLLVFLEAFRMKLG